MKLADWAIGRKAKSNLPHNGRYRSAGWRSCCVEHLYSPDFTRVIQPGLVWYQSMVFSRPSTTVIRAGFVH